MKLLTFVALLTIATSHLKAETLEYSCMDTWRGSLSHFPSKPDTAEIQDVSKYQPKVFSFADISSNEINGSKDQWLALDCNRQINDQRDLLDCSSGDREYLLHFDILTGTYAEWLLNSGVDWSIAIMSRGKCKKIDS
ncbi:hypothetical protein [Marinobacterium sp. xm-d-579]|uniref:hypothetical protein n=1 Tax=Marinobacterium sp. xm-d-579 TaxID=2497734 RepID=UPI001568306A|nr:hypothetical protein [Marinobacterium sp. xm-d-579]